jgi:hypothetical protein
VGNCGFNASNSSSSISCFLPNSSSFSWYFFACLMALLNYALFLTNIRENHDQAEEHYKKSLELGPDNAIVNGNYAFF